MFDSTLAAVGDFNILTDGDLVITSGRPEQTVRVDIRADGIAGEPVERFTISSMAPASFGTGDAMFLFRDSVIQILDEDGKCEQ